MDTYHKDPPTSSPKPVSTHNLCLMCPAVTEHLESGTHTCPQVYPMFQISNALLCVPFFYVEYKKNGKTVLQAFHQCRIYCISGIKHLAALGTVGFPVYGLVTTGLQGTIMVAWSSHELIVQKDIADVKVCLFSADSQLHSFLIHILDI